MQWLDALDMAVNRSWPLDNWGALQATEAMNSEVRFT
jgi:hypothetical protein